MNPGSENEETRKPPVFWPFAGSGRGYCEAAVSGHLAAALLVFFTGPTRTGLVSADLAFLAHERFRNG
jgi:hypothetical protein